jgi:uncharacterized protein
VRLNNFQIETILNGVEKFCGKQTCVWLFGSRVDDSKSGGDIDLYIELDPDIEMLQAKLKLLGYFEIKLGEQKIDILMRYLDQPMTAMHEIAKSTGVVLKHKA